MKMIDWYVWSKVHVQTFDFQNNGDWWFARSDNSGNSGGTLVYTSWEWWRFYVSSSTSKNVAFYNSSIFDGKKLKKIKIRWYKWNNQTLWICSNKTSWSTGVFVRYALYNTNYYIEVANNVSNLVYQNVWTHTWEITIEMNFEANKIYGNVNGTDYELSTPFGQSFIDAWDNQTLACMMDSWQNSAYMYYRKIEITTQ